MGTGSHSSSFPIAYNKKNTIWSSWGGALEEESSTESADNVVQEEKPPSDAGVQFMITLRMRRVLIDELSYLPQEVDCMDPQVAAVVIERGLSRPAKGMPSSWKIQGSNRPYSDIVVKIKKHVTKACSNSGSSINKFVRSNYKKVLIGLGAYFMTFYGISHVKITHFQSIFASSKDPGNSMKKVFLWPLSAFRLKKKKLIPRASPVNVKYLDAMTQQNWFENASIQWKKFRRNLP